MRIDKDNTYQTGHGREVRIYAVDGCSQHPVHGAIKDSNGEWGLCSWSKEGLWSSIMEHSYNLVLVPKRHTREVWINMYPNDCSKPHLSESDANKNAKPGRIACVHQIIDFVEGEGL